MNCTFTFSFRDPVSYKLSLWQQEFCNKQRFQDGCLVKEDKLIWFLDSKVLNRRLCTSRYTKHQTNKDEEEIPQTLGSVSINGYVSALINLYNLQVSYGANSYPHPRGPRLRAVLEHRMRKEFVRKKREYSDQGAGTLLDGYREGDVEHIIQVCWTSWAQGRGSNSQTVEAYLCTACDFLLAHNMLL